MFLSAVFANPLKEDRDAAACFREIMTTGTGGMKTWERKRDAGASGPEDQAHRDRGGRTQRGLYAFSIMLLNYLAGYRRRRAALMEWNSTGDLERLEKVCTGMVRESSAYRVLEADYFKHAGPRELAMALGAGYDDILIDFGVLEEGDTAEFLRCEKQFVVASFSEWQQENLREFAMERERTEKESWQYLAVFGSDETRKEFWRRFGILSRRIPFSADAFLLQRNAEYFLKSWSDQEEYAGGGEYVTEALQRVRRQEKGKGIWKKMYASIRRRRQAARGQAKEQRTGKRKKSSSIWAG